MLIKLGLYLLSQIMLIKLGLCYIEVVVRHLIINVDMIDTHIYMFYLLRLKFKHDTNLVN